MQEFEVELGKKLSWNVWKCVVPCLKKECVAKQNYHSSEKEIKIYELLGKTPYVVEFFGIASVTGFILLEFGGEYNLDQYLKGEVMYEPEKVFQTVAKPLFKALLVCHRHGIIHNDVKPANILVGSLGVKLCDFDYSVYPNSTGEKTSSKRTEGTPSFLCPTKFDAFCKGKKFTNVPYSFETDVWSAGVTLWSIWFKGKSFIENLLMGCNSGNIKMTIPKNKTIPNKEWHIIERILEINGFLRPNSSEVLNMLCDFDSEESKE